MIRSDAASQRANVGGYYQDLAKSRVPPGFRGRPAWFVQIWWCVQASLFAWSPQVLYPWRSCLLRLFGMKIGQNVKVAPFGTRHLSVEGLDWRPLLDWR